MKDFFDEDFPLSAKQEEEYKKRLEELEAQENQEQEAFDAFEDDVEVSAPVDEEFSAPEEVGFAEDDEPFEVYYAGMSETEEIFDSLNSEEPEEQEESICEPEECEEPEEIIEHDPIDSAPIFSLELDEPLDDGFLPDAPIVIPEQIPEEDSEDTLDDLSEELRSLTEKLDSMERAVNAMNAPAGEADDEDIPESFSYEYDDRFFAEEETTAYKHPELMKKPAAKTVAKSKKASGDLTISLKTLAKVGAVVAGTVVAAKLLSDDKKK